MAVLLSFTMESGDTAAIRARIDRIRRLADDDEGVTEYYEAACLAQSVIHDTLGGSHPVMAALVNSVNSRHYEKARAAARTVVALYDEGALKSPRLTIAGEIEGDILDLAEGQAQAAERNRDSSQKLIQLAIAAFLAGAALEDALRRLCEAHGVGYDSQTSTISKLQAALYQPSKQIEFISRSESKHVIAWGDTRNKADHGKFADITQTEVVAMILGVRSLIEKHLP